MKSERMFYARNKSIRIILSLLFFFICFSVFPQSGEKFATNGNNLSHGNFLGSTNAAPLIIKTNNTQRAVFTSTGWFGLGIAAPTCIFDVVGDGRISNFNIVSNLTVGNLLTVKKITSPSGTVDFGGNHLTTTGTITANNINVTNYSNPSFSGSGSGIITYDNNGVFQKLSFNNDANTVLLGNGTFSLFPTIGWSINGNNMYSIPSGNIGIGTQSPTEKLEINGSMKLSGAVYADKVIVNNHAGIGTFISTPQIYNLDGDLLIQNGTSALNTLINSDNGGYVGIGLTNPTEKLDVAGNANIRGYLYVQDGVIIGKRVNSEKVVTDTLQTDKMSLQEMTVDSITAQKITLDKLTTNEINAIESIKGKEINAELIVRSGQITIDGPGNKIYSSLGGINFNNNNLNGIDNFYANIISGGTLNVQSFGSPIDNLEVSGGIKVGNSSIILGEFSGTGAPNNIYAENNDLYIQSIAQSTDYNTLLNAYNNGNVGIGTNSPQKKLHVKTSVPENVENPPSEYTGSIRIEHDVFNVGNSTWDLEPIVNNNPGFHNRFSIGTPGNTSMFTINDNGNVGIGTLAPKDKFQIGDGINKINIGSINNSTICATSYIGFNSARTSDGWLFNTNGASNGGAIIMVSNNGTFNFITKPDPSGEVSPDDECSGHTGTSDEIFSDSQIANKSKMTIASNGRIGIGTTLPYTKFHIKGTSQTDAVLFLEPGEWNSAGDYSEIRFGDATHYIRGEHTNGMKFYDANQFSFTGGNVGIGTIDPKSALHIKSDDGTLSLEGITHTYIQYYPDGVDAGRKAWTGFGSSDDNNFTIANEISGANIILSLNGGNVGIGTSNPGSYKLAVEGKIGARAIKITLAPWADFVFEKNYSLTPLNNLESFINKNKHLPNIPPAHEIEKNGLDVAEIIAKQMQKIEELTLYLIELNKKIQKLEFEYNTLKK